MISSLLLRNYRTLPLFGLEASHLVGLQMVMNAIKKIMDNPPENLIFPGIVEPERMKELYALADLFLLPSYNELFPMTILEAASCEAPIMLRDLDLYKVILEGNYRPTTDVEEMNKLLWNIESIQKL